MKRAYVIFPLIAAAGFAGYFAYWQSSESARHQVTGGPLDVYDGRSGKREAEGDLRAGNLTILTFGLPAEWDPEFREVLERTRGIHVRAIAGCVVSQSLIDYAADYNRVMNDGIKAKFGGSVFELAQKEAQVLYAQRRPADYPVPIRAKPRAAPKL